jgi:cell volume regulation protein A
MALKRAAASARRVEIDLPGQTDNEMVGYPVRPDSYAALRPASLPAWLKPVIVVRDGAVKNAGEAGQIRGGDYAYFISPQDRVNRLDRLFAPLPAEAVVAAKRTAFGEFAVAPDASLSDLATFYEMQVPPNLAGLTVAEAFSARHGNRLRAGSRLTLASYAELMARVVEDGQLLKASLRLEDVVDLSMRSPQLPPPKLVRRLYDRLHQRFAKKEKPVEPAK